MAGHIGDTVSQHWNTPPRILKLIYEMWPFVDLDPCSNEHSIVKSRSRIQLPGDGLKVNWTKYETVFCNPPYGRDKKRGTSIEDWIYKAYLSSNNSFLRTEIILLIPAATETDFWDEYVWHGASDAICFIKGRVNFMLNGKTTPGFSSRGSALVYHGIHTERFKGIFKKLGAVIDGT